MVAGPFPGEPPLTLQRRPTEPNRRHGGQKASWKAPLLVHFAKRALQSSRVFLPFSQVANEAELQRCAELLTEEELQECYSSGDAAVRRERVLARAHVRWALGPTCSRRLTWHVLWTR